MIRYSEIVFLQGEEGREVTDSLFNVEGVVAHGVTAESFTDTLIYLKQWDYGSLYSEADNVEDEPQWGSGDTILFEDDANPYRNGAYIISANLGLGYVELTRVINTDDNAEEN